MNENKYALFYPNDGYQFVEMFLDKKKYAGLIEEHDRYKRFMNMGLSDKEYALECFQKPYEEVAERYAELKNRIFHAALQSFADEYARRLIDNCVGEFFAAPPGEEAEWIRNARQPNIYLQGQYERLSEWYSSLDKDTLHEIACRFEDEFGPIIPDDPHFEDKCDDRWNRLSVEDQELIYQAAL